VLAIREPSLGPVFGIKGGAAGGGYAQVVPMEDLNLHFTGDIHAITAANNFLAAFIDAHILHRHQPIIDPSSVGWRRVVDVNDRNLRDIVTGLGGKLNGIPRQTGFDITAASEVMAIMAMATDLQDLRRRLGAITVGYTYEGEPVTAEQVRCAGTMAVLLKDALKPNMIQTLEGQPCLMHCGPFANIAHGNNSVVADRVGLKLGDYLVTESGFGSDMGMEKFFDIVCRAGGLRPHAVVVVATVRALRHHGGGNWREKGSAQQMLAEIEKGTENLAKHIENAREFGIHAVCAVNRMPGDSDDEVQLVRRLAIEAGAANAGINEAFEHGGRGAAELAEMVVDAAEQPSDFRFLYPDDVPLKDKIEAIATRMYGADGVDYMPEAETKLKLFTEQGYGSFSVCMAKTHLSLSHDATLSGRPRGFRVPIRDVRAYTGAGFLVPLLGEMRQMPGLGASPAGFNVDIDENGKITGLF
jgi:formate--tetrahydrofolate ligase